MKWSVKAIVIIGVLSPAFLLPLFQPPADVQVFPEEIEEVMINVQQPTLHVSTTAPITINISKVVGDGLKPQRVNVEIDTEMDFKLLSAGFYVISIHSSSLATVQLDQQDFYPYFYMFYLLIALAALYMTYKIRI